MQGEVVTTKASPFKRESYKKLILILM